MTPESSDNIGSVTEWTDARLAGLEAHIEASDAEVAEVIEFVQSQCPVNIEHLTDEMRDQTEKLHEVARHRAEAVGSAKSLDNAIRLKRARIHLALKGKTDPATSKPYTEGVIEAVKDSDEEVVLLRASLSSALSAVAYTETMAKGFDARANMIINLEKALYPGGRQGMGGGGR